MQPEKTGFGLRIIPGVCNDLTEKTKALVTPLKRGEVKTYRLPIPVEQDTILDANGGKFLKNKRTKGYTWPASVQIPTMDIIMDTDGVEKQIAVVNKYELKTGEITPVPLFVGEQMDGFVIIHGGQSTSEKFYAFLELTDFNGSKPDRDISKPICFYAIDVDAESAKEGKNIDILTEELIYVKDMSKAELIMFSKNLQWDTVGVKDNVLRNRLKSFILKKPGTFSEMFKNRPKIEMLAFIKEAMEQKIIMFNPLENKYTFTGTGKDIATFTRMDGKETIEQFADWMCTHKDAAAVKSGIKNAQKQVELSEA